MSFVIFISTRLPFEKFVAASLHGCICGIKSRCLEQHHAVSWRHKQDSCNQNEKGNLATVNANCTSWFQIFLPAMQALIRDTHVPVIIALNTRDDTSPRLEGHIEALRGKRRKRRQCLIQIVKGRLFLFNFPPEKLQQILTQASNHDAQWAEVSKSTEGIRGDSFWSDLTSEKHC